MTHNYAAILEDILGTIAKADFGDARKVDYIPALASVPDDHFAMVVRTADGRELAIGQTDLPFSIQSISKVFALVLALRAHGDDLWKAVRREPSGSAFNSLILLEQ